MIRFIDLSGQITEEGKEFAFYDTVTDRFIEIGGDQIWENFNEVVESTLCMGGEEKPVNIVGGLNRLKRLYDGNRS